MSDPITLLIVSITFFVAGGIKGVVGLGLPTISLGLLAVMFDLVTAIVLTLLPSLITNIWQAFSGAPVWQTLSRIAPFLIVALAAIWWGAYTLATLDTHMLTLLLGILLIVYALTSLLGIHFSIPPRHQKWAGVCLGALNGSLTGMAGVYIVPSVMYFQAIGMRREELVTAMGILFSLSSISMLFAYDYQQLLTPEQAMLSLFAVLPALIGMYVGQAIRRRLSETTFKKLLFIALFLLGLFIVLRNLQIT